MQHTSTAQIETIPMGQVHTAAAGAIIDTCTDPYGKMVATANSDGTIRIYSASMCDSGVSSEAISCLTYHRAAVCRVVWTSSANGNIIISAGHDGLLLVWQEMGGMWRVGAEYKFTQPLADIAVVDDSVFVACLDGYLSYCKIHFQENPLIEYITRTACKFIPLSVDVRIVGDNFQVACGLLSGCLLVFLVTNNGNFTEQNEMNLIKTPSPIRSVAWGNALLNPYGSLAIGYETGELLIYKAAVSEPIDFSTPIYTKTVERPLCRIRYGPTGAVVAIAYGQAKSELLNPFSNIK